MAEPKKYSQKASLTWWQLSLVGIGGIIGTGFFLGSSLGIRMAGPSILVAFLAAAFSTYVVYDNLAQMTANDPVEGSFRSYAKQAFGRWAGFSSGWVYWSSEMLMLGSQMTAIGLFSRFWFPKIPLWMFALLYAALGILIVLLGVSWFDRLENGFAVIKVAAIVMFIILALLACFGWIHPHGKASHPHLPKVFMPHGLTGLWSSLIYALYGFGGIEMMGLMAIRLQNKKEAPKAGRIMLIVIVLIYILSIGLAVYMVSWRAFTANESPFVIALNDYQLSFFPHIFNGALIIAGFSTMSASLFSVTSMLATLGKEGDAPSFFAKTTKRRTIPLHALGLTIIGMSVSSVLAFLMPGEIYEYMTTAAGLMLIYNWLFITLASRKLLTLSIWGKIKHLIGNTIIVLGVCGTLLHRGSRPGLIVSLAFLAVIGGVVLIMRARWKHETN